MGFTAEYRWRRNGVFVFDDSRYSGAATPSLVISNTIEGDSGAFDLLVMWQPCPPQRSDPAAGIVSAPVCLGDADGSGFVDFGDIARVLANFGVMCP